MTVKNSTSFALDWTPISKKAKVSRRKVSNELNRSQSQYATKSIDQLLIEVQNPSNKYLHDVLENHKKKGNEYDMSDTPKYGSVKLKYFFVDEDMQRNLDPLHVAKILEDFDPRRVNFIQCIKIPGKKEYHSVDGQHTAVVLALLACHGFLNGVDSDAWKELEIPIAYIETDDRAWAREQFAFINGAGKKKISLYDLHKQRVLSYRLDKNTKKEYTDAAERQAICEAHNCFPISSDDLKNLGIPGTITHIQGMNSLNPAALKFLVNNHNTYWSDEVVDNAEFGFCKNLFNTAVEPVDSPNFMLFTKHLNAIIKTFFTNPCELGSIVNTAYSNYSKDVFGVEKKNAPNTASLNVVLKIYQRLGGTYPLPSTVLSHCEAGKDLYDYLPVSIRTKVEETINS